MVCRLCGDHPPEMWDHMRLMHPEEWDGGPESWPDGELVVHDLTLTPTDFEPGKE